MTTAPDPNRSTRLVVRQVSELLLARWQRWQTVVPESRLSDVVFGTVLSASIAHHPLRDPATGQMMGIAAASDRARPVSASAIGLPMALALTSVRRCADELVDAGVLARGPAGYTVALRLFAENALVEVAAGDAADVARVLRALGGAGFRPAADAMERGAATLPADVVSRQLLTFALRSLETVVALHHDFTLAMLTTAIIATNIRHITEDSELSRRYAAEDALPPDAVRRPVALRELARALDIPFETVRRRVAAMIADGVVVWADDGVIVPAAVLRSDRHVDNNRRIAQQFERMIAGLVSLLARPADPPTVTKFGSAAVG